MLFTVSRLLDVRAKSLHERITPDSRPCCVWIFSVLIFSETVYNNIVLPIQSLSFIPMYSYHISEQTRFGVEFASNFSNSTHIIKAPALCSSGPRFWEPPLLSYLSIFLPLVWGVKSVTFYFRLGTTRETGDSRVSSNFAISLFQFLGCFSCIYWGRKLWTKMWMGLLNT